MTRIPIEGGPTVTYPGDRLVLADGKARVVRANADIDAVWPPRGPCAFCGWPDARHRIFDAIRDRSAGGEHITDLAFDYDVTEEAIATVLAMSPDDPRVSPDDAEDTP